MIRPKLEYCSRLFLNLNTSLINKLETTQNKALRAICKARKMGFSATGTRRLLNVHTLLS